MSPIIAHAAQEAHPDRDAAARKRADRLAKATTDQMQAALAYLSVIDDEAFEIAFAAVGPAPTDDDPEDDDPIPYATPAAPRRHLPRAHPQLAPLPRRRCRLGHHDPGHAPEVAWYLPDEDPEDL